MAPVADLKGRTLRQRLAWALAALGVATALLLGVLFHVTEEAIEQASLRQVMQSELNLLARRLDGQAHQFFFRPARGRPPPPEWSSLPVGTYDVVQYQGLPYQLLIGEAGPGDRIYLAQSLIHDQRREVWLLWALALAVLASALLAIAVSDHLARQVLRPLQVLLEQVRGLHSEWRGQRLTAVTTPELDELMQAFNDYMRSLDRLVAREQAFAGAAAHELHTPLAVIAGATELLATRHPADPALPRLQRAAAEASHMLDMLLSLSGTREAPPPVTLLLAEELPRLAQQCALPAAVRLRWELATPGPVLEAPAAAVALIFLNLLRNALRAANSEVLVSVDADGLSIHDDGPGVAAELLPQVFEPGVRGTGGGTGLGLHIARAVAERQGWSLGLVNGERGGAIARWRWL